MRTFGGPIVVPAEGSHCAALRSLASCTIDADLAIEIARMPSDACHASELGRNKSVLVGGGIVQSEVRLGAQGTAV